MKTWIALFGAALWFAAPSLGQEIRVGDLVPVPLATHPMDQPPRPIAQPLPDYPQRWLEQGLPHWATLGFFIDDKGVPRSVDCDSDFRYGAFSQALQKAARRWRFEPARYHGKAVASGCRVTIIFNAAAASSQGNVPVRILRTALTPHLPPMDEFCNSIDYRLKLRIRTDGQADILSLNPANAGDQVPEKIKALSRLPEIQNAVRATVQQWRFAPALEQGVAVERVIPLGVTAVNDRGLDFVPPKPTRQVAPEYPMSLRRSGNKGEVMISFLVTKEGTVEQPVVLSSSHPDFEAPAVAAVLQWRFKPGLSEGRPIAANLGVPIIFLMNGMIDGGSDPYAVNRHSGDGQGAFKFDVAPVPKLALVPVYPWDALLHHQSGSATVTFFVAADGSVALSAVRHASRPDFGQAAAAAVLCNRFEPATLKGKATVAALTQDFTFDLHERDFELDSVGEDLLDLIKAHSDQIVSLAKLDRLPHAKFQPQPRFPADAAKGTVLVEFYLDETGRARFPHVISADNDALAYPALTAISRWQFEVPLRHGKAVPAVARIPIVYRGVGALSSPQAADPTEPPK